MNLNLADQLLSTAGALMVLGAYIANLVHKLDRDGAAYAALNALGSGLLAYTALKSAAIGLIAVEAAWAVVSLFAVVRAIVRRPQANA